MQIIGSILAVTAFLGFSYFTTAFLYKENPRTANKEWYRKQYLYHLHKSNEHKAEAIKALNHYKKLNK